MNRTGVVLEMTEASQLHERHQRVDLLLYELPATAGGRIGDLYRRIWEPIGGGGRSAWTDQQWIEELSQPRIRSWVAQVDSFDAGMAEVAWSGDGDAAFVVIGVTPDYQQQGIGGDLLSRLTRLMWKTPAHNGTRTRRVWVWTVPDEHPATIPNYLARGFEYAQPDGARR